MGRLLDWPKPWIPATQNPNRRLNAYSPRDVSRVIFHEIDPAGDPRGQAYIKASESAVLDPEAHR